MNEIVIAKTGQIEQFGNNNVGDYSLVERGTTDTMLVALWAAESNSEHTRKQYTRQGAAFLDFIGKPIQAITLKDLQDWRDGLTGKPNTIRLKINAIKSLLSFAHALGYIRMNPGVKLKPPAQVETKHRKVLGEDDVILLVNDKDLEPVERAIVHVLYSTGCRVSELCAMRWGEMIPVADGKGEIVIQGKGGNTRTVGISAKAMKALEAIKPEDAGKDDLAFVKKNGEPYDRFAVHYLFRVLSKKIGEPISPHWLRHSHVTHALDRGASPTDVQAQAGHSSLKTTSGYAHSSRHSSDYLPV